MGSIIEAYKGNHHKPEARRNRVVSWSEFRHEFRHETLADVADRALENHNIHKFFKWNEWGEQPTADDFQDVNNYNVRSLRESYWGRIADSIAEEPENEYYIKVYQDTHGAGKWRTALKNGIREHFKKRNISAREEQSRRSRIFVAQPLVVPTDKFEMQKNFTTPELREVVQTAILEMLETQQENERPVELPQEQWVRKQLTDFLESKEGDPRATRLLDELMLLSKEQLR